MKVGNRTTTVRMMPALLFVLSALFLTGQHAKVQHAALLPSVGQNQTPAFTEVAQGIEYSRIERGTKTGNDQTGPWVINVLRIDPARAKLKLVHAMDAAIGLEAVSSMATRYAALAAINGGYFRTTGTYRGDSEGVLMLDGRLLSETNRNRAAVGMIQDGERSELVFGQLSFKGAIMGGRSVRHEVNGINRPRGDNELVVFTPEFHRTTLTNPAGAEIIVRRNRVAAVRDGAGSSPIPADGFVVSVSGAAREWALRNLPLNSSIRFDLQVEPLDAASIERWKRATSIVGGGPQLIRDGKTDIRNPAEGIADAFVTTRHPRTAIAKLGGGSLLLVTVDGRQPGVSAGMSLTELAALLLEFGATEGLNLDGGGSTTMFLQGKVVNKPSDAAGERAVSDAILVFPRTPSARSPR